MKVQKLNFKHNYMQLVEWNKDLGFKDEAVDQTINLTHILVSLVLYTSHKESRSLL